MRAFSVQVCENRRAELSPGREGPNTEFMRHFPRSGVLLNPLLMLPKSDFMATTSTSLVHFILPRLQQAPTRESMSAWEYRDISSSLLLCAETRGMCRTGILWGIGCQRLALSIGIRQFSG